MSDESLTIEMQSRPREEDARCLPSDYEGPGFWDWNGKRYVWNDNMIEKIKCAATRHGDHIVAGENHAECLQIAQAAGFEKADQRMGQGFLTTGMRFVLRREALAIASREGQIHRKHNPGDVLLSEDLR